MIKKSASTRSISSLFYSIIHFPRKSLPRTTASNYSDSFSISQKLRSYRFVRFLRLYISLCQQWMQFATSKQHSSFILSNSKASDERKWRTYIMALDPCRSRHSSSVSCARLSACLLYLIAVYKIDYQSRRASFLSGLALRLLDFFQSSTN